MAKWSDLDSGSSKASKKKFRNQYFKWLKEKDVYKSGIKKNTVRPENMDLIYFFFALGLFSLFGVIMNASKPELINKFVFMTGLFFAFFVYYDRQL